MKSLRNVLFAAGLAFSFFPSRAQTLNWKNIQPQHKHFLNLNAGMDNGSVVGVAYGYRLRTKVPVIVGLEYSMPFGEKLLDDFKTKIGGQVNVLRSDHFFASVKAYGIFRRFENDLARLLNFGSEFSATAGYYRRKWFIAADAGFDKAIITHVKHSDLMKEYNPDLVSGWYIPTGGHFLYGLQLGRSFRQNDIYLKVGKTVEQDLKTSPSLPIYFQLGWSIKW